MKLAKHAFKELQEEWYRKLADAGFKDIERFKGDELILVGRAADCYKFTTNLTRPIKEEYYRWISQEANDEETVYRNEADKHILTRYSEGAKVKVIVKELKMMGMPRHRHSIRFIIRRYEMEWGLREYNDRMLNIKKKA